MNTVSTRLLWLTAAMMVLLALQHPVRAAITANDVDGDGVHDTVDLDDDNDGIPDIFEIGADGLGIDSDKDGMPDRVDLDSDNDGILDWQESGAVMSVDFSAISSVAGRLVGEVGANGLLDVLETSPDSNQLRYQLINSDAPADNIYDVLDLDSDNDGLPDLIEAGVNANYDSDGDARIDAPIGTVGNDGIADYLQTINDQSCCDVTGDGVDDVIPRNTDASDLPDYLDLDSDNDGAFDLQEAQGLDTNNDGRVDNVVDLHPQDGLDDAIRSLPLVLGDSNGNGLVDVLDPFAVISNGATADNTTGGNGVADDQMTVSSRDPAIRPDLNPASADAPLEDDPGVGTVLTGLNAGGCSIQSSHTDWLLLLLAVISLVVLGWRNTVRRVK